MPRDDGWRWVYGVFDRLAPAGAFLRKVACAYFRPSRLELARDCLVFRALGVGAFGRVIPTGGVAIRRATGARMRPYTLRRTSLQGARDFYYRTCVFEALHMPFFVALICLAAQRYSIGRLDYAVQESVMNLVVNLLPILHHRHTRARIVRLLSRARHPLPGSVRRVPRPVNMFAGCRREAGRGAHRAGTEPPG